MAARTSFDGANMLAWLYTIMRNFHYTEFRKKQRTVEDPDSRIANSIVDFQDPMNKMELDRVLTAMNQLPDEVRRTMHLIVIDGYSYMEVAEKMSCAEGTVKSRVFRGREMLLRILGGARYEPEPAPILAVPVQPTAVE